MTEHRRLFLKNLIQTWSLTIPYKEYDTIVSHFGKYGKLVVYPAYGNPWDSSTPITKIGSETYELFADFHDNCTTFKYDVSELIIDDQESAASWRVYFTGSRDGDVFSQDLRFSCWLDSELYITKAEIRPYSV